MPSTTRRLSDSFSFAVPAALWAGTILVLFGGYELVERIWLKQADMRLLHALHILRGIVASTLTALFAGFYAAKRIPAAALFWGVLSADPLSEKEAARRHAAWFIQMRWIAVLAAAVAVFVGSILTPLLPRENFIPLVLRFPKQPVPTGS